MLGNLLYLLSSAISPHPLFHRVAIGSQPIDVPAVADELQGCSDGAAGDCSLDHLQAAACQHCRHGSCCSSRRRLRQLHLPRRRQSPRSSAPNRMKSINQLIPETIYLYRSIKNENTSVYPVRAATHQLRSKLKGLKSSGSSPCVILLYLISFVKQIKQTSAQCRLAIERASQRRLFMHIYIYI